MPRYVSTFRAVYDAEDEVQAIYIADQIRLNGSQDLDEDDGDDLVVTQTTSNALDLDPEEVLVKLRQCRNLLIKTRVRPAFEQARELDKLIYMLGHKSDEFPLAGYKYGDFMDICEAILVTEDTPDV